MQMCPSSAFTEPCFHNYYELSVEYTAICMANTLIALSTETHQADNKELESTKPDSLGWHLKTPQSTASDHLAFSPYQRVVVVCICPSVRESEIPRIADIINTSSTCHSS